jgi:hypothetical protein|tara:strand:- start:215 stop:445 length:231 start_codon:yes stop_codon:yes gene_type:complete
MPKDPSFDYYLDQQIEEHTRQELECGCAGVVTWPFGDHYCGKEYEEEEEEENAASYDYPSLRKFNPLAIILEEEDV